MRPLVLKGFFTVALTAFFAGSGLASPLSSKLLPLVPSGAEIVAGFENHPTPDSHGRLLLTTHNNRLDLDDWQALTGLAPKFLTWILSALTLGIFWLGQQAQLDNLARSDRNLSWLHYLFLGTITLLPFSTRLLSEFFAFRVALVFYWANILACGAALYLCWRYSERAGLVRPDAPPILGPAVRRRIAIAQALYFAAALVGLAQPAVGVVLIIAIQLSYAFSLPLPRRWRH